MLNCWAGDPNQRKGCSLVIENIDEILKTKLKVCVKGSYHSVQQMEAYPGLFQKQVNVDQDPCKSKKNFGQDPCKNKQGCCQDPCEDLTWRALQQQLTTGLYRCKALNFRCLRGTWLPL